MRTTSGFYDRTFLSHLANVCLQYNAFLLIYQVLNNFVNIFFFREITLRSLKCEDLRSEAFSGEASLPVF